ncbi:amidohydrolase family protein [Deinococcus cavernae]|uniref:amidohydrolase family protein n=1 Tax=Deinococcus cavernae TaxID=2320857 RepID=UPI002368159D|nr:amidohydrolase family protein [Deinococcus cavernae]
MGRQLYAVTPRFSLSASEGMLDACAALMREFQGLRFTSHINENVAEIGVVQGLFPQARDYLDTYERAGLVTRRSVLAHNVHPNDANWVPWPRMGAAPRIARAATRRWAAGFFP